MIIQQLQDHLYNHFDEFQKIDPDNIVGFHIDKKTRSSKRLNYYSIVFHLREKIKPDKVKALSKIPEKIFGELPVRKTDIIRTDVIEVGELQLQSQVMVGEETRNKRRVSELGTVGAYLKIGSEIYSLSNMHVYGANEIKKGSFYYYNPSNNNPDILIGRSQLETDAYFIEGLFSRSLDIAVAKVSDPSKISSQIPNRGAIQGYFEIQHSAYIGKIFYVYSRTRRRIVKSKLNNHMSIKVVNPINIDITMHSLLQFNRVTNNGDSGTIVFDSDNRIVGIIIGADRSFSYAVPIIPILRFFGADLYYN